MCTAAAAEAATIERISSSANVVVQEKKLVQQELLTDHDLKCLGSGRVGLRGVQNLTGRVGSGGVISRVGSGQGLKTYNLTDRVVS